MYSVDLTIGAESASDRFGVAGDDVGVAECGDNADGVDSLDDSVDNLDDAFVVVLIGACAT